MKLSKFGWQSAIARSMQSLPAEFLARVIVVSERTEPLTCDKCGQAFHSLRTHGWACWQCNSQPIDDVTAVLNTSVRYDYVKVIVDGKIAFAAVLVMRDRNRGEVHVPGNLGSFQLNSAKRENSAEALEELTQCRVLPPLGLTRDAEGFWGTHGGLRLAGGPMIPTAQETFDEFCRDADRRAEHQLPPQATKNVECKP